MLFDGWCRWWYNVGGMMAVMVMMICGLCVWRWRFVFVIVFLWYQIHTQMSLEICMLWRTLMVMYDNDVVWLIVRCKKRCVWAHWGLRRASDNCRCWPCSILFEIKTPPTTIHQHVCTSQKFIHVLQMLPRLSSRLCALWFASQSYTCFLICNTWCPNN